MLSMKRVIPILLVLLILLTSTCFAAYEPDPERWLWLGSDSEVGIFLDKETITYSDDKATVDFWICWVYPAKNQFINENSKIDKHSKTYTHLSYAIYDCKTKKLISSHTYALWEQKAEKIIPGTLGENFYRYFFPN